MNSRPEILAPVSTREGVCAAVGCGADAVYLGGKDFNARKNAHNFTYDELKLATDYCHARDVKVYLAVNTLVFDSELRAFAQTIRAACECGVDAFIVQDLGAADIIRSIAPGIRMHASTQMTIHSPAGARFAASLGFERIVAAREMSREELGQLVKESPIEVEVFVHGALCMCVSGQCYLSGVLGQRSANRGQCAQPCRLQFGVRRPEDCDLSLKDLSLLHPDYLAELARMGVASLKIEGRMKRPEYVAAAVTACRQALDGEMPDLERLRSVFSRSGFTDGYFLGNLGRQMFGVRTREDVARAQPVLNELKNSYQKEYKRGSVDMELSLQTGHPSRLRMCDDHGNSVESYIDPPQKALSRPTDEAQARMQLSKLGDTIFTMGSLTVDNPSGLYLSASRLNALRRGACEELMRVRARRAPRLSIRPDYEDESLSFMKRPSDLRSPRLRARFRTFAQIPQNAFSICEYVILPIDEVVAHGKELAPWREKVILSPVRLLFGVEDDVARVLRQLKAQGFHHIECHTVGHIVLGRECGMTLHGAFSLNLANTRALIRAAKEGLADAVVSRELTLDRARHLGDYLPYGVTAYGRLPVMTVRNCPVRNVKTCTACAGREQLVDRMGKKFPVRCERFRGRQVVSDIYNADVLYMADRLRDLEGFDFIVLDFTVEERAEVSEVLRSYQIGDGNRSGVTRELLYRGAL